MFILKSLQREGGDRKSGLDRSGCAIVASNRIRRDVREVRLGQSTGRSVLRLTRHPWPQLEPACFSTEHAKIDVTFPLGKEHIRCLRVRVQPRSRLAPNWGRHGSRPARPPRPQATIQPFGFVYEGAKYGFDISIPEQYPYKRARLPAAAKSAWRDSHTPPQRPP